MTIQTRIAQISLVILLLIICVVPAQAQTNYNGNNGYQQTWTNGPNVDGVDYGNRHATRPNWTPYNSSDYRQSPQYLEPPCSNDISSNIIVRGNYLYLRNNYGHLQVLTSNYSSNLQVAGCRIAMIDTRGYLVARDGIRGQWITEKGISNFDEYKLSSSLLVVRTGPCIRYKSNLDDSNWTVLTWGAKDMSVYDNTISYTPLRCSYQGPNGIWHWPAQ